MLQMKAYDLMTEEGMAEMLKDNSTLVKIHNSDKTVRYNNEKKTGVMQSMLGASTAISLGAYVYALNQLDK
jgi:glucokinase